MIRTASKIISRLIGNELGYDNDKMDVLYYGLQIILGVGVKLMSIFILSWILGVVNFTFSAVFVFAIFRLVAGGVHCNTYANCYFVSIVSFVLLGVLVQKIPIETISVTIFSIFIAFFSIIVIFLWVPGDTEKKRISNSKIRFRSKIKVLLLLIGWGGTTIFLLLNGFLNSVLSVSLGVLLEMFFVTPVGYKFIYVLESSLKLIQQKGGKQHA